MIQLNTDPSLLVQLAKAYRDWLPQPPPDPAPFLTPSLFCEGPFDAASCPEATTLHPLIGTQQDGCPYRITSYRDYEHSHVESPFGIQLHHPQFLEWVGALESARLLGRAPGEWLQVMSREQTLHAVLQLQRDANLMTSNVNVLQQYALSLQGTASAILQSVFGRNYFPSTTVHDAGPVPVFVGHLPTRPLWVSGAHRLGLMVQELQSFIRAPTVPGALHVICARPVTGTFPPDLRTVNCRSSCKYVPGW